jgi:tripartite-type tricarboxylate transporter receptor subunit TctC
MRPFLVLLASALVAAPAFGQDAYPARPITMIVPFPPGGVADLTGRPTAFAMEKFLKQRIIIENKAGAGGAVGMAAAANSKPDGYTILMALSSISIIPPAERLFGRKPPYEMSQLAPIALISADPTVMVVRAEAPWRTVKDFVEDAKRRPAKSNYSSSGIYGTLHMAMEIFANAARIKLWHVPYSGAGPR